VIPLVAVIGAATAAGFGAEHRYRRSAEELARRLMWVVLWCLMPPIAFLNIRALHLTAHVGAGIAFGYVAMLATMGVAWLLGTRVLRLERPSVGTLMGVSGLGNTGYMGLPFTAALLGFSQVPNAVAYDTLVSSFALVTIGFSIGAAFGTVAERPRERMASFFLRNPPLWATVLGFVAPHALAPHWAVDASRVLVVAILPIGFFAVGVTLAAEAEEGAARFPPPRNARVATAVVLKLLLPPSIVLGLSKAFIAVPEAYLSQAAMAAGINNLVVAHEYGLDRGLAAAAIAWTTAIVACAGIVVVLL
jgi:predicted permease